MVVPGYNQVTPTGFQFGGAEEVERIIGYFRDLKKIMVVEINWKENELGQRSERNEEVTPREPCPEGAGQNGVPRG